VDPAVWGVIGVIVGGLITSSVTLGAEIVRGRNAASLDRKKRDDDRQLARDAFQRETLLALQEALNRWMRAVAQMSMWDTRSLREQGRLVLLPEDLNTEVFEAGIRMMFLTERVTDDDLREVLSELRSTEATMQARRAVLHGRATEATVESEFQDLMSQGAVVQRALGAVLRRYL
jgi:hypothetical protein